MSVHECLWDRKAFIRIQYSSIDCSVFELTSLQPTAAAAGTAKRENEAKYIRDGEAKNSLPFRVCTYPSYL